MTDRSAPAPDRSKQLRILICGPSGSGKSSLLHCLVYHSAPPPLLGGTIGVRTDVSTTSDSQYMLEWIEIGGSPAHRIARRTFLHGALDGLILVCDATSNRSYEDALTLLEDVVPGLWQQEHQKRGGMRSPPAPGRRDAAVTPTALRQRRRTHSAAFGSGDETPPDASPLLDAADRYALAVAELRELPILIVANKADALPARRAAPGHAHALPRGTGDGPVSGRSDAAASRAWYDAMQSVEPGARVKLCVDVETALRREEQVWSYFGPCGMGLAMWRFIQRCIPSACLRHAHTQPPVIVEPKVIHTTAITCKVPFDDFGEFIQDVIQHKSASFTNHA